MGFTIDQILVNSDEKVVAVDWVYTNADGQLSNQFRFAEPYGDIPLEQVTTEVVSEWLSSQLPNEPAEFDAELTRRKEAKAAEDAVEEYETHVVTPPSRVMPEEPQQEETQIEETLTEEIQTE